MYENFSLQFFADVSQLKCTDAGLSVWKSCDEQTVIVVDMLRECGCVPIGLTTPIFR
jgi:hypothetical protein